MTKKIISILLSLVLIAALTACGTSQTDTSANSQAESVDGTAEASDAIDYPTDPVLAIIPYAEGGGKDIMARGFAPYLEEALGGSIVLENRAGSSGAVGAQYVQSQPADGYTIYIGGESVETFQIAGLLDVGYDDWEPIIVLNKESQNLLVNENSIFADMDFDEFIEYVREHPGEVTYGTTGVGSVQWNWVKLLEQVFDIEFLEVSYESGGDQMTALLGGNLDVVSSGLTQAKSYIGNGIVAKTTFDTQSVEGLDTDLITEYTDAFDDLLPYGAYVVLMVKAGTDQAIVDKLVTAATEAYASDGFQEFVTSTSQGVGLTGDDARAFLERAQSITAYLLYDAGELDVNPADYGIERVA